jgi:hypothetical protein
MLNKDEEKEPEHRGTSNYRCFKVQMRMAHGTKVIYYKNKYNPDRPQQIVLNHEWHEVPFEQTVPERGVRNHIRCKMGEWLGYMSYHTAKALQYQVHTEHDDIFLETRLVEYFGEVTHKYTTTGHVEVVDGRYPHQRKADDDKTSRSQLSKSADL